MKTSTRQKIGLIFLALFFETILVFTTFDFKEMQPRSPYFLGMWTTIIIAMVVDYWKEINLNEKYKG